MSPLARRRLVRLSSSVALLAVVTTGGSGASLAQSSEPQAVEGSADFRTAPRIVDGTYRDSILSGDSVWYSMLYTNAVPYTYNARLLEQAPEDASFTIEFIAPSLTSYAEPSPDALTGSQYYGDREPLTYTWYLKATLSTTGEVGNEYDFEFTVEGANGGRTELCDSLDDCDAADESDEALTRRDEAAAELAEVEANGGEEAVRQEIEAALVQVGELEAELEPKPTTPVAAVVLLVALGVLAAVGGFMRSRKRPGPGRADGPPGGSTDADPPPSVVGAGAPTGPATASSQPPPAPQPPPNPQLPPNPPPPPNPPAAPPPAPPSW